MKYNKRWPKYFFIFTLLMMNLPVEGYETSDYLQRFKENPESASNEIPEKHGYSEVAPFKKDPTWKRNFASIKDKFRSESLCKKSAIGEPCEARSSKFFLFERMNDQERLREFLSSNYDPNIRRLQHLNEGSLGYVPWTGYYWPFYEGGIGNRYGDPTYPRSLTFRVNLEYYKQNFLRPPNTDSKSLGKLSPAEKYDYLLGDNNWSLTRAIWNESESYMDSYGEVETWMGICHGWAPASIMVPEPRRAFSVNLDAGRGRMKVYPHDVKALVSQLWARANVRYKFLGGRCNKKNPAEDSAGRIISPECFDVNPSTWHLALTHMVGQQRESFILDSTYDYEVWNQPIYNYRLRYFNPETKEISDLERSIVPYSRVISDPYRKYRSPEVQYLVGVISEIKYVMELNPSQSSSTDTLSRLVSVSYYYDLELDKDYNIIGGEWYQKAHPDLLWKPARGAQAYFNGENRLPAWRGSFPLPNDYLKLSNYSSLVKMPLGKVLDQLTNWSQGH